MDYQMLFNVALGVISALGGYVLRSVNENLQSLQSADSMLIDKVQRMEVLLAGQYVTNDALTLAIGTLHDKLDRIWDKLDMKQDKQL
jgi:hypothetical protein